MLKGLALLPEQFRQYMFILWKVFRTVLFLGRKQTTDWLKTYDDLSLVSNVVNGSSPLSLPRAGEVLERNCKQVHAKLRLIEEVDILQDDTEGKGSTVSL